MHRQDRTCIENALTELDSFAAMQKQSIERMRVVIFCDLCAVPFHSMKSLMHHKRCDHGPAAQPAAFCKKCDEGFPSQAHLRKHVTLACHYDGWYCFSCRKHLKDARAFINHVCKCKDFGSTWKDPRASFGYNVTTAVWQCSVCCMVFWGTRALQNHVAGCKLDCNYCNFKCFNLYHYSIHTEDCRAVFLEYLSVRSGEFGLLHDPKLLGNIDEIFVCCNYCNQRLVNAADVRAHSCRFMAGKPAFSVVCLHCKGYFLKEEHFFSHVDNCFKIVMDAFRKAAKSMKASPPRASKEPAAVDVSFARSLQTLAQRAEADGKLRAGDDTISSNLGLLRKLLARPVVLNPSTTENRQNKFDTVVVASNALNKTTRVSYASSNSFVTASHNNRSVHGSQILTNGVEQQQQQNVMSRTPNSRNGNSASYVVKEQCQLATRNIGSLIETCLASPNGNVNNSNNVYLANIRSNIQHNIQQSSASSSDFINAVVRNYHKHITTVPTQKELPDVDNRKSGTILPPQSIKKEKDTDADQTCENCLESNCMIHTREIFLQENIPKAAKNVLANKELSNVSNTYTPKDFRKGSVDVLADKKLPDNNNNNDDKKEKNAIFDKAVVVKDEGVKPSSCKNKARKTFSSPNSNVLAFSVFNNVKSNVPSDVPPDDDSSSNPLTFWGICTGCKINFVPLFDGFCSACRGVPVAKMGNDSSKENVVTPLDAVNRISSCKSHPSSASKATDKAIHCKQDGAKKIVSSDAVSPTSGTDKSVTNASDAACDRSAANFATENKRCGKSEASVRCTKCGHNFDASKSVDDHVCDKRLEKMKACSVVIESCNKNVADKTRPTKPRRKDSDVIIEYNVCRFCDKRFLNRATFEKHACKDLVVHPSAKRAKHHEQDGRLDAPTLKELGNIIEDKRLSGGGGRKDENASPPVDFNNKNETAAKFQCPCGAVFPRESLLEWHLRTHDEDRPFVCQVCHSRFKRISNLKEHWRFFHLKGRIPCMKCDMVFPTSLKLREHSRVHTTHYKYNKRKVKRLEDDLSVQQT